MGIRREMERAKKQENQRHCWKMITGWEKPKERAENSKGKSEREARKRTAKEEAIQRREVGKTKNQMMKRKKR